jgi:hypothetical protein
VGGIQVGTVEGTVEGIVVVVEEEGMEAVEVEGVGVIETEMGWDRKN